jgi:DnaJ homolog subfamily B member 12
MSAKASGADSKANGDARNRQHNDGSSGRAYTVEQKAAVLRIRKCDKTDFYEILGLSEVKDNASGAQIKKAYHKLSLLTHPDKNGHEGAAEAFKCKSLHFNLAACSGGRVHR